MYSRKTSCFECLENTILKRSKCCREISQLEFFNAYSISNQLNRIHFKKIKFKPNIPYRLKLIGKCAIAMAKYKKRLKVCGAQISYRLQRFYKNIKKKYYNNAKPDILH